MAATSSVLKDVEEQLTCPICLSLFEHPKVLRCHHVFCRDCLRKCIITDEECRSFVCCSACRQKTQLPEGGVEKLEAAFNVNKLFDTRDKLVKADANEVTAKKEMCELHPDRLRELWCETCSALICFQCSLQGEKHCNHHFYLASKLVDQMKQEMIASCDTLKQHQSRYEETLQELNTLVENLYATRETTMLEIQKTADSLREAITLTEVSAIRNLNDIVEEQATKLSPYRDKLEVIISEFQFCIQKLQTSLGLSEPSEIIGANGKLCEEASKLSGHNQDNAILALHESDEVEFFSDMDAIKQVLHDNFFVYVPDVCNSDIQVSGKGLSSATVGDLSSFRVDAISTRNKTCKYLFQGLQCQLQSDITNQEVPLVMAKESDASYLFSYHTLIKGTYSLKINYKGKPVSNSPYQVAVTSKQALHFSDIFFSKKTTVCPTDMVVSKGKIIISSLSSFGVLNQQLEFHPFPGANILKLIESERETFFAVVGNISGIIELGNNGNKWRNIVTLGCDIADITYDKTCKKLFVLLAVHSFGAMSGYIVVYSLDETVSYILNFGRKGQGKGKLDSPKAIMIHNDSGTVFIADTLNNRIQVFDSHGKYLHKIDAKCLIKPTYLTTTKTNLFVSNVVNYIFVFDLAGSLLHTFQSPLITNIVALAVDNYNVLYVCDDENKQVLLF